MLLVLPRCVAAEKVATGFVERIFRDEKGEHRYMVFIPHNYTPERRWPVILFLHGAGERGNDGFKQTTVGLGPFVRKRAKTFPFLVVFPQCEDVHGRALGGWLAETPDAKRALAILAEVERDFAVDRKREILTGWSMGGYGSWSLAAAYPERWHAVVPLAGGGDPAWAEKLKSLPIWAFHGVRDRAIPVAESRRMVKAIRDAGGEIRYTEVPGIGHDVWKIAYGRDELFQWMLDPTRPEPPAEIFRPSPEELRELEASLPFKPAVEIPRAVSLRLGNDALKALAYSAAELVPAELLQGTLEDSSDSTTVAGRTFSVYFSGIHYQARLHRAHIRAYRRDRLNIQLALRDAVLTLGQTYVVGRRQSATAGPIQVVLGHRRPIWLSFDVTPRVVQRRLRLKLAATRFHIPDDNWYVTAPAWVSANPIGMTSERVSDGLVQGLYENKSQLESQVSEVIPALLPRLEEELQRRLVAGEIQDLLNSFWPLPLLQPRLRLWPDQVTTDDRGVTLVLGVTAAALDPAKAPARPLTASPAGPSAEKVPPATALRVGLSLPMLAPLSEMLIREDFARIHVLDIPERTFANLADREVLKRAIPDLARLPSGVELRSEFLLKAPISVSAVLENGPDGTKAADATSDGSSSKSEAETVETIGVRPVRDTQRIRFHLPQLVLAIATRTGADAEWMPLAEFEIHVTQDVLAEILRPSFGTRSLQLQWSGHPQVAVSGQFAAEYKPVDPHLDAEVIRREFIESWRTWTRRGPVSRVDVPMVEFGKSRLALAGIGADAQTLMAEFATPGIRITNRSEKPLVYRVRSPYGRWSETYTLEPGSWHQFDVPYPLTWERRVDSRTERYTLAVGQAFEFRPPRRGGPPQLFQQ